MNIYIQSINLILSLVTIALAWGKVLVSQDEFSVSMGVYKKPTDVNSFLAFGSHLRFLKQNLPILRCENYAEIIVISWF